ncbi:hypothetical protein QOZ80_5AG0367740 [Eleusine coracana subsp. coracana]|nr:hypothetical protein QOZ80_5AG0367740 [Eleusine coracana subsp. coracana]
MAASTSNSVTQGLDLEEERRHSPIPYRSGLLEYEPAINCYCGRKAAMWISWSDRNPGRRYLKCYRALGSCSMYGWYEGPIDAFVASLLVDLRNVVWSLKGQKADLKEALDLSHCRSRGRM